MDTGSLPLIVGLELVALLALGFLATASAAISGLSRGRYQRILEDSPERAQPIGDFVERQQHYQLALGAARTIVVVAATYLATLIAPFLDVMGTVALVVGLLAALLLVGQAVPRIVVAGHCEDLAEKLSLPIRIVALLMTPITLFLGLALRARSRIRTRVNGGEDDTRQSTEELRDIIGERVVEEDELEMIDSIFELEETTAREIMVPRMDIAALPNSATVREAIDVVIAKGYSRLPVYDGSIDNVVGVVYAKDLLPVVLAGGLEEQVGRYLRQAYFIPESKKIDDLLAELQARRVHIAIVVDEYGGTAGLVTIEDLLEEIVGEIQDEFDAEEEKIVAGENGEAVFDATVSIDDVNHTLGLDLAGEEVDTIGGLVYEQLGKVPLVGDQVTVGNARVEVVSTSGRRIRRVKVTMADSVPAAPAEVE